MKSIRDALRGILLVVVGAALNITTSHAAATIKALGSPVTASFAARAIGAPPYYQPLFVDTFGRVYIASNGDAVVRYDGNTWQPIALSSPLQGAMFGVALADGRFLIPHSRGVAIASLGADDRSLVITALAPSADDATLDWATIGMWESDEGYVTVTNTHVIVVAKDLSTVQVVVEPPPSDIISHKQVYAIRPRANTTTKELTLAVLRDGAFVEHPWAANIAAQDRERLRYNLRVMDTPEGIDVLTAQGIVRITDAGSSVLRPPNAYEDDPSCLRFPIPLSAGKIAISCDSRFAILDAKYAILVEGEVPQGLITGFIEAHDGTVFVTTTTSVHALVGIGVVAKLESPLQYVTAVAHQGEHVWLASLNGLSRIHLDAPVWTEPARIGLASGWLMRISSLHVVGEDVLFGQPQGLFCAHASRERAWRIGAVPIACAAAGAEKSPDSKTFKEDVGLIRVLAGMRRVLAFAHGVVAIVANTGGAWRVLREVPFDERDEVVDALALDDEHLLLIRRSGERSLLTVDHTALTVEEVRGEIPGLPSVKSGEGWPARLDSTACWVTADASYCWDGERFAAAPPVQLDMSAEPGARFVTGECGNIMIGRTAIAVSPRGTRTWTHVQHLLEPYSAVTDAACIGDAELLVAASSGLYRVNLPALFAAERRPRLTPTNYLVRAAGSIEEFKWPKAQNAAIRVAAGVYVEIVVASDAVGNRSMYRFKRAADTRGWSDWSEEPVAAALFSSPGRETIAVEARTSDGRVARIDAHVEVAPHWYQRASVQVAILLAAGVLLVLGAREYAAYRTRVMMRANEALQGEIAKRSHELSVMSKTVETVATMDAVTELPNANVLRILAPREWVRCVDTHQSVAAIVVDVDHLRRYNEVHGLVAGDDLLRRIGYAIREVHDPLREILVRLESDKFVLVLPGASRYSAATRAEAIRDAIRNLEPGITSTIGVAAISPRDGDRFDNLIELGRSAVVRAKQLGRDRIEVMDRKSA